MSVQCPQYVSTMYDEHIHCFEKCIEIFLDDFMVYNNYFDDCLHNLSLVMKRCIEINFVLNYEKCHFMGSQGIVLGHLVSAGGIEVDKTKVDVVSNLPYPSSIKDVWPFVGSVSFYHWFIKDFSRIALPLSSLLQKDAGKLSIFSKMSLRAPRSYNPLVGTFPSRLCVMLAIW